MISIALFEDNPVHQEIIKKLIHTSLTVPHFIYTFSSVREFFTPSSTISNNSNNYEIIFMDIELGDDSGIALAQEINKSMPDAQIIYITQHLEYVSSVYESRHIYFINKQYMDTYIPRALEIALEKIQEQNNLYLEFNWSKEHYKIKQKDILYIERVLRTTEIHTAARTFYTSEKISIIHQRLNTSFVLSHRSYIINMNAITNLEKDCAILKGSIKVPISRSHYKDIKRSFHLFLSM